MHTGALAFESNAGASVGFMALWIMLAFCVVRWRLPRWVWWFVVWAAGMWAYFSLLAISAGPAPVLPRGDIAIWIRWGLLAADGILAAGLICLGGVLVRKGRVRASMTFRLALIASLAVVLAGCAISIEVRPLVDARPTAAAVAPTAIPLPDSPLMILPGVPPGTRNGLPLPGTTDR